MFILILLFSDAVIFLILLLLKRLRNIYTLGIKNEPLADEQLELHVKNLAEEHSEFMTNNILNWPVPGLNDNYNYILSDYKDISSDMQGTELISLP